MPYETIDTENHLNWLLSTEYKTRTHIQRSKTDKRYLNNFSSANYSIAQYYEEEKQVKAEGGKTYGEKYWVQNDFCLAYWHERQQVDKRLRNQLGDKYDKFRWKNGGKEYEKFVLNDTEVMRLKKANREAYEEENNITDNFDYKKLFSEERAESKTGQLTLFQ